MNEYVTPVIELRIRRQPWSKGNLVVAKPPLRPSHVWSIRTKLQIERRSRELALNRERNLAERSFNVLKQHRGIATRYDKLARTFLAGLLPVCVLIWLR